jgi:lipid-binding SYLF domain-containing protein
MKRTATIYSLTENHSKENESSVETRRRRKVVSPRESVIRNLLNYSKALAVVTTPETGFINLVMN